MGLAGFVVGFLYGAVTNYFDQLSGHPTGVAGKILSILNASPIIMAALGLAVLIWLSGTLRLPQKPGAVFVICIPAGALIELLLSGIIGAIVRTIA